MTMLFERSKQIIHDEWLKLQPLRDKLLKKYPDRYILFRHGTVQAVCDTQDEAYRKGLKLFGLDDTFLIEHLVDIGDTSSLQWVSSVDYVKR